LNISITPIEKEKNVGSFSVDILVESEEGDPISTSYEPKMSLFS